MALPLSPFCVCRPASTGHAHPGTAATESTIYAAAIDAFSIIIIGILVAGLAGILLAARLHPGSGADVLDWKPTRSTEVEAQNELDDIDQMLEAQNEIRRRRGVPVKTEDEIMDEWRES